MKWSLKWKLTFSMSILAALCTLLAMGMTTWLLIQGQEENTEQNLRATAATLMSLGISDYHGLEGFEKLDQFIEKSLKLKKINKAIHVFTRQGKLMFSSVSQTEKAFMSLFKPVDKPYLSQHEINRKRYKILITPYQGKNGKEYFLQLAMPAPDYREVIVENLFETILLFSGLCILAFFIAQILSARIAKPVQAVAFHLNQLDTSEIKNWSPLILGESYLKGIIFGINELKRRVKVTFYNTSRTSRYLAHEICNPLTILIGEAETVLSKKDASLKEYQEVIESSLEEIERIHQAVQTITEISQKERAVYHPGPLNISQWLDQQILKWEKDLGQKIQWQKPPKDILAVLDESLLFRLVDNLIRNIKKHTALPSEVKLSLREESGDKIIEVLDAGPGMPDGLILALNENRSDHALIGIGLALCQEIASICGIKLHFENRKDARGLKVSLIIQSSLT